MSYVNDLLRGRSAFGRRTAKQRSDTFGLSEQWLLNGVGGMVVRREMEMFVPVFDDEAKSGQDTRIGDETKSALGDGLPPHEVLALFREMMVMHREMLRVLADMMNEQRETTRSVLRMCLKLEDAGNTHEPHGAKDAVEDK